MRVELLLATVYIILTVLYRYTRFFDQTKSAILVWQSLLRANKFKQTTRLLKIKIYLPTKKILLWISLQTTEMVYNCNGHQRGTLIIWLLKIVNGSADIKLVKDFNKSIIKDKFQSKHIIKSELLFKDQHRIICT